MRLHRHRDLKLSRTMMLLRAVATIFVSTAAACCSSSLSQEVNEFYSAKSGSAVDADTNAPIKDAYVIAEGRVTKSGGLVEWRRATVPAYRLVTHTDANGYFTIPALPNQVGVLEFNLGNAEYKWTVTALVPGFVDLRDEKQLIEPSEHIARPYTSLSSDAPPPHTVNSEKVQILPLRLRRHSLSLAQAFSYYSLLSSETKAAWQLTPDENHTLNDGLFSYYTDLICSSRKDFRIDLETAGQLLVTFARDRRRQDVAVATLANLEPDGFDEKSGRLWFKPPQQYSSFLASNVCQALRGER